MPDQAPDQENGISLISLTCKKSEAEDDWRYVPEAGLARELPSRPEFQRCHGAGREVHLKCLCSLTKKTLNIIEEGRRARLEGKTGQYRELKGKTVRAVRKLRNSVDSVRQRKANCDQLTIDLSKEESDPREVSDSCVPLNPRPAVLQ